MCRRCGSCAPLRVLAIAPTRPVDAGTHRDHAPVGQLEHAAKHPVDAYAIDYAAQ